MRSTAVLFLILALVLAGCGGGSGDVLPATDAPSQGSTTTTETARTTAEPPVSTVTTTMATTTTTTTTTTTEAPTTTTSTTAIPISQEALLEELGLTEEELFDAISQIPACDDDRQSILEAGACKDRDGVIQGSYSFTCDDGTEYRAFKGWYITGGEIIDGEPPTIIEACGY